MSDARVENALKDFCAAAEAKGDFASPPSRDHELHHRMKLALQHLRAAGASGDEAFRGLLQAGSPRVRTWAAAELLSRGDGMALGVLERLAEEAGLHALSARVAIQEYRAGRLRSPFA